MALPLDDNNGVFSYEKSFKQWLDEIFTSHASSDYPSRLRKFFTRFYKDNNAFYNGIPIYSCLDKLPIDFIERWIDTCLIQTVNISDCADRSNIRSALNKFKVFMQERRNSNNVCITTEQSNIYSTSSDKEVRQLDVNLRAEDSISLSKKEMRDVFMSQFKSEDRRLTAKKGIIYPIKAIVPFINRETGDRGKMTKFFNKHIDKIKILLSSSRTCLFKEIERLTLETPDSNNLRTVSVLINGQKEYVYTKHGSDIIPMRVNSSSDINRDHDKAISKILESLDPNQFPCFSIVSEACRNVSSKTSTDIQNSLNRSLIGKDSKSFAENLYKEIERLFLLLSITLMEGQANRMKSASI